MDAATKTSFETHNTVEGIACPLCSKPLPWPTVMPSSIDRYGRELRSYFGWCFDCDRGFCVVQFKRDDCWVIHKYRPYAVSRGVEPSVVPWGDSEILNELPEPAPIVLGPGGDYDRHIELERKKRRRASDGLHEVMMRLKETLNSMDSD